MNNNDYSTVFHLISNIFKKTDTTCILIGGFAINFYKVTRQTADVDFLITKEDFENIVPELKESGYKEDYIQEVFTRFKGNKKYLMDIDFMFVDKDTLDKIIKNSRKIAIANQEFFIPSLDILIALKLHSLKYNFNLRKNKDLPDIINLIKVNRIDCKTEKFKELCLKYGNKEIYDKILEMM